MAEFILETELAILNLIQMLRCSFLDLILTFITHLGDKGFLWIALGLGLCFVKKHRRTGVCILLALLINLIICNLSLKPLIARVRPYEYAEGIKLLINEPHDFSFPSGHSSSSFAAAFSVWYTNRKWGTVCALLAGLIAFSRLYLYVHFPSDVLFGILIGILSAFAAKSVVGKSHLL
ncbi:MAG: phosphatase PAP2 family protein [Clostridia bacterium]|nr:phosphatase PAP2 family protein [Clostridia bacterium]